jgi:arabinofuranosyltransferase
MNDAPPPMTLVARIGDRVGVRAWYRGRDLSPRIHLVLGLLVPMVVMAYNMWRVRDFTVDDAYISFRYAVNLVDGYGLVYNPGEAIEGYTNFLWTLLVAAGISIGVDPHVSSKVLGALAALGTLVVVYRLSARVQPYGALPCLATWLLATAPTTVCWAMFGLETSFFVFLIALGLLMMFEEHDRGRGFPFSALVFALAGLTRPEAPMFLGLAMLLLGPRKMFARQNLVRGVVFVIPLFVHMLWRHGYYGGWTPATLAAKTGDLKSQMKSGRGYVLAWLDHSGPINFMIFYAVGLAVARRSRELGTFALLFFAVCGYVMLVGGDWMSYYRHMAMAEPFVFLGCCIALRSLAQRRDIGALVAIALVLSWTWVDRNYELADARKKFLKEEKRFWDNTAGQVAEWLVATGKPGRVALGDIGYVGYRTNYPILDLLGLVDPVISQLPGGYTKKNGPGYSERFYELMPEWAVLIHSGQDCEKAGLKAVKTIVEDPRFLRRYKLMENFQVNADGSWCVFKRKDF